MTGLQTNNTTAHKHASMHITTCRHTDMHCKTCKHANHVLYKVETMPCTNDALCKPCLAQAMPCTNRTLYKTCLVQTMPCTSYALYKSCLAQTTPCTNQVMHKPCPVQTMPCTNHALYIPCLAQTTPCTNHVLYKPRLVYTNHALYKISIECISQACCKPCFVQVISCTSHVRRVNARFARTGRYIRKFEYNMMQNEPHVLHVHETTPLRKGTPPRKSQRPTMYCKMRCEMNAMCTKHCACAVEAHSQKVDDLESIAKYDAKWTPCARNTAPAQSKRTAKK